MFVLPLLPAPVGVESLNSLVFLILLLLQSPVGTANVNEKALLHVLLMFLDPVGERNYQSRC